MVCLRNPWSLVLPILFALSGCSGSELIYDCDDICEKYAECIDASLDPENCMDHCEGQSETRSEFEQMARDCEQCIDDLVCDGKTPACSDECTGVVAEQLVEEE